MKLYELTTNYLNLLEVLESGEVEPEVIGQALEEVKEYEEGRGIIKT